MHELNDNVLDITLDKKGNSEASIKIMLREEDYQPRVDEKLKAYRRQANLKGFRPGKVPVGLIKRMYGKAIKVEEINELLAQKLPEYIQDNDLKIVGEPLPNREAVRGIDWEAQSEFEFSYEVGYVNEFSYELSETVTVTKYIIPVTEEKVDETTEDLRKRFGKFEDVEGSGERTDLLTGVLSAAGSKNEVTEEAGLTADASTDLPEAESASSSTPTTIDLSSLTDEQAAPFVGAQAGDELFFDLRETFPDDESIADLFDLSVEDDKVSGLEGEFSFQIEKVGRQLPAEVNQDLFDAVFGRDTVKEEAGFREKVREAIQDNYQRQSDTLLDRDIQNHFLRTTAIDIPEQFLRRWLLDSDRNSLTEEQVDAEFDGYVKNLKWTLLSNKIAEDLSIKVDHEEIKQKAKETLLAQFGMPGSDFGDDERFQSIIDNYLQRDNGSNYMGIFEQVRTEKLLDGIKQRITIQEKEVTLDEFNRQAAQE